jgi:hypothetical protein
VDDTLLLAVTPLRGKGSHRVCLGYHAELRRAGEGTAWRRDLGAQARGHLLHAQDRNLVDGQIPEFSIRRDRLSVGQMTTGKSGGRELANTLSHACVASSPGLCIFCVDEASSNSGKHTVIDTYRRKLSSMGLENYGSSSISGGWTCDSPQGEGCGVNELTLALTLTLTNHKAVGG